MESYGIYVLIWILRILTACSRRGTNTSSKYYFAFRIHELQLRRCRLFGDILRPQPVSCSYRDVLLCDLPVPSGISMPSTVPRHPGHCGTSRHLVGAKAFLFVVRFVMSSRFDRLWFAPWMVKGTTADLACRLRRNELREIVPVRTRQMCWKCWDKIETQVVT